MNISVYSVHQVIFRWWGGALQMSITLWSEYLVIRHVINIHYFLPVVPMELILICSTYSACGSRQIWFGLWCLTPLPTIFQLNRGGNWTLEC